VRFSRQPALAAILLLGLALRITWAIHQPTDLVSLKSLPDQLEYLQLGDHLLHGQGLQFTDDRFGRQVWAYRTPGYPVFVALCGGRPMIIRIAQAILDTGTVLAIWILAGRWLSPRQCLVAAGLVAANPLLIYFTGLILSETLFTAMLAWGMVLLTFAGAMPIVGLLILAASILVRPSAIALPVFLAIAIPRRKSTPQRSPITDDNSPPLTPSPCTQGEGRGGGSSVVPCSRGSGIDLSIPFPLGNAQSPAARFMDRDIHQLRHHPV
jgi:hypothetical protein